MTPSADKKISRFTARLKIPVYSCLVTLTITSDIEADTAKLKKKIKADFEEGYCAGRIIAHPLDIGRYYMFLASEYVEPNTITHEIFHLTRVICRDIDVQEEEAQALIAGFLGGQVWKFIFSHDLLAEKPMYHPLTAKDFNPDTL